jgi:hypothetical protein
MKKAYLVYFESPSPQPSLIFAEDIFEIAMKNRAAYKIEEIDCWIVPGQLKEE